jgi:hypothetical protein
VLERKFKRDDFKQGARKSEDPLPADWLQPCGASFCVFESFPNKIEGRSISPKEVHAMALLVVYRRQQGC